jgi:hypothetical protein
VDSGIPGTVAVDVDGNCNQGRHHHTPSHVFVCVCVCLLCRHTQIASISVYYVCVYRCV